jgi:hypothetical protein
MGKDNRDSNKPFVVKGELVIVKPNGLKFGQGKELFTSVPSLIGFFKNALTKKKEQAVVSASSARSSGSSGSGGGSGGSSSSQIGGRPPVPVSVPVVEASKRKPSRFGAVVSSGMSMTEYDQSQVPVQSQAQSQIYSQSQVSHSQG